MRYVYPLTLAASLLLLSCIIARADDFRYECTVIRVLDGDTVGARCDSFPPGYKFQVIRVDGVDTPESRRGQNGAKCEKERKLGLIAKAWAKQQMPKGSIITAVVRRNPKTDEAEREKYGRVLGDIEYGGKSLRAELFRTGNARPYGEAGGESKSLTKSDWCS